MSSTAAGESVIVDVVMPHMGSSVVEGTVVAWSAQVGDRVAADQTICEISTDKIDTEIPSPVAGELAEILVPVGETVEVGVALARIRTTDAGASETSNAAMAGACAAAADDAADAEASSRAAGAAAAAPALRGAETAPNGTSSRRAAPGRRYSPVVLRIASKHGVELAQVPGTGRGGRVTKRDVLAYLESGGEGEVEERPLHIESPYRPDCDLAAPPAPAASGAPAVPVAPAGVPASLDPAALGGDPQPLSRIRQSIGAAMRRSQETAATCTTVVECDVSQVERRRRELGLTALPLIARCAIETLREYPDLNATLQDATITRYERVHLGIAVSLGEEGLIVPVIHDAQALSPEGLGARIRDLALRARAKQLLPDEVQGATFTITNPGQYGALMATPVIPLPQVAILDLEAIVRRPVVVTGPDGQEAIAIRPIVNLCMSWDHRAIDGAYAAQFLTTLRRRIEALSA